MKNLIDISGLLDDLPESSISKKEMVTSSSNQQIAFIIEGLAKGYRKDPIKPTHNRLFEVKSKNSWIFSFNFSNHPYESRYSFPYGGKIKWVNKDWLFHDEKKRNVIWHFLQKSSWQKMTFVAHQRATFHGAELRVFRFLYDLVYEIHDTLALKVPLTQNEIAELSGVSRATVNKILSTYEEENILERGSGYLQFKISGLDTFNLLYQKYRKSINQSD